MEKAAMLGKSKKTENWENCWPDYQRTMEVRTQGTVQKTKLFFINTGNTKGTAFRIRVQDHVFSSLFNTGAQVSCIKYDTVAVLGLLHQISGSSTCIRTANGQDICVKGSIVVSFKIGPCSFTHKFVVCEGITRAFILGEEFLSHHCFKLEWTDGNKRFAKYRGEVITVASQSVMDDRIMDSPSMRIPARHFVMVPTKCPNMFSGRVEVRPCPEFKNKFPKLYLEPMQYNNPDSKWQEAIPYMIINLEYDKDIYRGKDTVMAYAWEEDKTCEYLEVNEIIESAEFRNWASTKGTESDLVFSPAQVTEQCCVELKHQEISQETKERFKKLKEKYPKVFSVSSQDIGHTHLVTMHVDTGDNPLIC